LGPILFLFEVLIICQCCQGMTEGWKKLVAYDLALNLYMGSGLGDVRVPMLDLSVEVTYVLAL